MEKEVGAHITNQTFEWVTPPAGAHILGSRFVYDIRSNEKGEEVRRKARFVVQGCAQTEDEYFENEIYAPYG
jgi:Reverse transcriptase (RNA-dependent DNA polymerase).